MKTNKIKEEKLLRNVELAGKIVLKEDEKLFKELGKEKELEKGLCVRCKKNKATLQYAQGYLEATHGFIEYICQECYDKIRDNNPWFQEGIQKGRQIERDKIILKIKELNKNAFYKHGDGDEILQELLNSLGEKDG